jgi:ABC-type nickel/cobalt efflux system permease component RcnA
MERAREAEHERDTALARYHNYEIASAAFQIGIVLCSAAVITATIWLAFVAGGVAVLGVVFMALGLFAPHALHLA